MPETYNDGTNGTHDVTYIADGTSRSNGVFSPIKSTLTSITLPRTITKIGLYAFFQCTALENVDLRDCTSLTSIDSGAFGVCSGLLSIDLSGCISLTSIGLDAFVSCSGLTSLNLSGCTSLTSIDQGAFYECSGLTSITIPSSVTIIGINAFKGCSKLTSVVFEDTSKTTWYVTSTAYVPEDSTTYQDVSSSSSTNATNLVTNYCGYYWCKHTSGTLPSL